MVAKEGLPALRRRPPSLGHVFCDRGLADINPEFEQFAMNPWRSPQRVGNAHLENELANFRRRLRPAAARSRSPAPIRSETGAMPTDYCLRLEDFQRVEHLGRQAIEPAKQQAIDVADGHPLRRF